MHREKETKSVCTMVDFHHERLIPSQHYMLRGRGGASDIGASGRLLGAPGALPRASISPHKSHASTSALRFMSALSRLVFFRTDAARILPNGCGGTGTRSKFATRPIQRAFVQMKAKSLFLHRLVLFLHHLLRLLNNTIKCFSRNLVPSDIAWSHQ